MNIMKLVDKDASLEMIDTMLQLEQSKLVTDQYEAKGIRKCLEELELIKKSSPEVTASKGTTK